MDFYDIDRYSPVALEGWKQRTLRSEYRRLREEANTRLKAFTGTEWTQTEVYRSNYGRYDQNINRMSNKDLRYAITEVIDFLNMQTSTVEGLEAMRDRQLETFHAHGYEGINKQNWRGFTEFMDRLNLIFQDTLLDSDRAVEIYEESWETADIDTMVERYRDEMGAER